MPAASSEAPAGTADRRRGRGLAVLAVAALLAAAAALRLSVLPGVPGGLYPDEAAEGVDAWKLLHQPGFHPVFFDDDGGREGLFAYLVAAGFRLAGTGVGTLRGTAAVLGVLGVAAVMLALWRFGVAAALLGGGWSAGSVWLVAVDRDGFRNVLVPLVGALALWALLRFAEWPSTRRAVLAGAVSGLGLWTYQPLKLLPLLVLAWLLWLRRADARRWPSLRRRLPALTTAYVIVAAPMLLTAVIDPSGYFARGASVSVFNHGEGFAVHVLRTLATFGFTGDPNARHNAGDLPLLSLPLTLLAAAGAWVCWRRRREPAHALVGLGLPVFLVPALVATEGDSPHFLRLLGLAPYLAALLGIGAVHLAGLVRRALSRPRAAAAVLGAAWLAVAGATAQGAVSYFGRSTAAVYDAYSYDVVALARAAARTPHAVVVVDDYRALTVRFIDIDTPVVVVSPGRRVTGAHGPLLGLSPDDLRMAAGDRAVALVVVASDPQGHPRVWETAP